MTADSESPVPEQLHSGFHGVRTSGRTCSTLSAVADFAPDRQTRTRSAAVTVLTGSAAGRAGTKQARPGINFTSPDPK